MRFDVLTLFPEPLAAWLDFSIVGRARNRGLVDINLVQLRRFALDSYGTVDDRPAGGGAGMVMRLEPLMAAVDECLDAGAAIRKQPARVILTAPQGRRLDQALLEDLADEDQVVILCGHYEGFDDRIRALVVTDEVSLGDFVLTGGEMVAAALIDGVTRLLPGALGKDESAKDESFSSGLLEYPHYTRPAQYLGLSIPPVLLSGNHGHVARWRERQALLRTAALRPDLLPPDWRDRLSPPRKPRRKRRPHPGSGAAPASPGGSAA
jgi:tRNA (guanine37-N1)-methyltransferase